jgi:hypothetical protein
MTEENQKLLEEIIKVIAEQFGAKYTLWYCQDKYKQSKKIVIEYDNKGKGTDL